MTLLVILSIILLLYLFRGPIQSWLAMHLVRRMQRTMEEAMGAQSRRTASGFGSASGQRSSAGSGQRSRGDGAASEEGSRTQKQQLDAIEARKFDRRSSDEYVDFEELPDK